MNKKHTARHPSVPNAQGSASHYRTAMRRHTGSPRAKGYSEAGANVIKKSLKAFRALSGSPREDIDENNSTLRQRGRMLYMGDPVAAAAINTNRTKVVGTGLTLKSTINRDILDMSPEAAKEWERRTEAEFNLWASKKENCDACGVNNFYALQQLVMIAWMQSGDVFGLFKHYDTTSMSPYSLRIHIIEADRVSTPSGPGGIYTPSITEGKTSDGNKIYDGVEVDKDGRIVAYHICNHYPYQQTSEKTEWQRVPAYGEKTGLPNILHIMASERPDQYRGVTYLAPVIEPLLQLRRYTEAELMAALVQAFLTAWIKTEGDTTEIPLSQPNDTIVNASGILVSGAGAIDINSQSKNEYTLGPATINVLGPGEDVILSNPNIPTAGFDSFVKAICRIIGTALELPYDVLMKEFNASYSASRAALLEAWEAFKMRRRWIIDDFCQPVYEVWLAEAVARGRIKAPGFFDDPVIRAAWCGAQWIGPVQGQIEPVKEAKAAEIMVQNGFKTREQVTREFGGGDWNMNIAQIGQELKQLREAQGDAETIKPDSGGAETAAARRRASARSQDRNGPGLFERILKKLKGSETDG